MAHARTKEVKINGEVIVLGRLTCTQEAEIFFDDIAPKLGPLLGEALDKFGPLFRIERTEPAKPMELGPLLERLVKELPWRTVNALATKVLAASTSRGQPVLKVIDVVCVTALDYIRLLVAVLDFLYSDFYEALASLRSKAPPAAASVSEGSTTPASSGPSGG